MNIFDLMLHNVLSKLDVEIPVDAPEWVHPLLHVAFIITPGMIVLLLVLFVYKKIRSSALIENDIKERKSPDSFPSGVYGFIYKYSGKSQMYLLLSGVVSLPLLYLSLELPKNIINKAIAADEHVTHMFGVHLTQLDHLYVLCFVYLVVIVVSGVFKYNINVYRGKVSENLLFTLRNLIYQGWCQGKGVDRSAEIIPIVSQEVEPVGGFAGEAVATPVIQGGTFVTIVFFMFMQNPILGAAAITLIPIQVLVIPRYQRRLNEITRSRLGVIRKLGGLFGEIKEPKDREDYYHGIHDCFSELRTMRGRFHKIKFLMKFINNILIALTPFTFYSIGGYLVVNGQLSLGALIAVLSAYKDLSSPLRELFKYYQTTADVSVRYEELRTYLV